LRVRINRKVATTADDSNKQGDVQAMEFGIPGYDILVKIGASTDGQPATIKKSFVPRKSE